MSGARAVRRAGPNPWLVAFLVAGASFMEVLDATIANVVLPYIAGGLGSSEDEASWVVTTYLVANAIIVTASAYLAKRFGRKSFFVACLMLFTGSSLLCGLAPDLNALLVFRLLQGFAGGGMVPVAQSILADSFPAEKRGQAFALFGVAVVVAPVIGPTLGGWLADNASWRACFLINVPVGILMTLAIIAVLHEKPEEVVARHAALPTLQFDRVGFVLVTTFLGALELVSDRGLEDDWFHSNFIITTTIICAAAFLLMVPWEWHQRQPAVDVRLVVTRQFGTCFLVLFVTRAILVSTGQFVPRLVQLQFDYTATWAGLVMSPGGLVAMAMMPVVGKLTSKVQPKYLIAIGALIAAGSMFMLTNTYGALNFWYFAKSRMLLSVGLPLIFIPITTASYAGLPPGHTDQASALLGVSRNTGGAIGIALFSNLLANREQFHQSRLVESVVPSGVPYQQTLHQVMQHFLAQGSTLAAAQQQAIQWMGQVIGKQAAYLGYVDAFWALTLITLAAVPLALTLRNVELGGRRGGH